MSQERILPDLQGTLLCEDVRQEINGMQTLVGVLNVLPAPVVPIGVFKLCLWTRWCGGLGRFRQVSRLRAPDDETTVAEAAVDFELREIEAHATNVHIFAGFQLRQYGMHHVEIELEGDLRMRFPLPVIHVPGHPHPPHPPQPH